MLFHSFAFIFILLPCAVAGCELIRRFPGMRSASGTPAGASLSGGQDRKLTELYLRRFLAAVSAVFALFSGLYSAAVLAANIAVNALFILFLRRCPKKAKALRNAGVILNLGMLAAFKYTGVRFPLAISFYTFQQISLLADLAAGKIRVDRPSDYLLSVLFFPKLIQGPISKYNDIIPEASLDSRPDSRALAAGKRALFLAPLTADRLLSGTALFTFGLAKKTLLADTLGAAADYAYASIPSLTGPDAFLAALTYALQLYFDFSGYCDMGMGAARMLGIEFDGSLINFRSPFKSLTMEELWRHWHASLMRFFRDYVYIPLGGSRRGERRTLLNLVIVFFLSGLWHGNGLNFIVWGLANGAMVLIDRKFLRRISSSASSLPKPLSALVCFLLRVKTFVLFSLVFVFFRAPDLAGALSLFRQMLTGTRGRISAGFAEAFRMKELWYVLKVMPAVNGVPFADTSAGRIFCLAALLIACAALVFLAPSARQAADRMLSPVPEADPAPEGAEHHPARETTGGRIRLFHVVFVSVLFVWALTAVPGVSTFLYANF